MWIQSGFKVPIDSSVGEDSNACCSSDDGDAILSGLIDYNDASCSAIGVILLHPHPALGGNINNNVLKSLRNSFREENLIRVIVALNSRGVYGSTGRVTLRGDRDAIDTVKVCEYLLKDEGFPIDSGSQEKRMKIDKIIICGYSWGSCMATRAVVGFRHVIGFIAISPPLGTVASVSLGTTRFWKMFENFSAMPPLLILVGENDSYTSVKACQDNSSVISDQSKVTIAVHSSADHFWVGQECWIQIQVHQWFSEQFYHLR